MKHPDLLEGMAPAILAHPRMPHIGGRVGVGFAGGGGSSIGLKAAGLAIDFAMNHDAAAIAMHAANCPEAKHYCQDIWQVDPLDPCPGEPIRFMWFSPDCKHFSKAKGGAPVEKKIRDLAWVIVLWARLRRPDVISIENVEEFQTWGPLLANGKPDPARRGLYFRRFNAEMRRLGYAGDWRELRACDFGTPTSRKRLFGQFRCDGIPIAWPEPTHGSPQDPAVIAGRKLPWKTAASDVIDWSQPCHSIFLTRQEARRVGVNRPLVDATFARLTLGLQRFVLEAGRPYIVPITHRGWGARPQDIDGQMPTITCAKGGEHALAVPNLLPLTHHGAPRADSVETPVRTITSAHRGEIATVASYISRYHGAGEGGDFGGHRADEPALTDTAGGNRGAVVAAHITKFRDGSAGASVEAPAPTITANSYQRRPGGAAPIGVVESFVSAQYGQSIGAHADEPVGTQLATVKHAAMAAHMVQHNSRPGGDIHPGRDIRDPISTITTGPQQNVAVSHLTHLRGSGARGGHDVDGQVPTLTATRGGHIAETRAYLVKYFQSAQHGQGVGEPLHTVTTKPRFALVTVDCADLGLTDEQRYTAWWVARLLDVYGHPDGLPIRRRRKRRGIGSLRFRTLIDAIDARFAPRPSAVGRDGWIVWDIGMRMLTVRERYRAQGVDDRFIIDVAVDGKTITATKQGEMCGNMVCPQMSEAIARAALPELADRMEMAA